LRLTSSNLFDVRMIGDAEEVIFEVLKIIRIEERKA